jgi:5'-3' exonuclease
MGEIKVENVMNDRNELSNTLIVIDGFNLLSRAYFATSYNRSEEQLKNSNGIYTNAIRVFFQKMINLTKEYQASHLVVAWDVKRDETSRRQEFDFYKATRGELPMPLIEQYETCHQILSEIGVRQIAIAPHEADDVIGTIATNWTSGHCFIYSNDRDLFQLLSDTTSQIIASKQGEYVYDIAQFTEEYGIKATQWVDVKALLGDSSDNIPGCPGIGPKSALPLIQHYGSIEHLYANLDDLDEKFNRHKKKLVAGKESTLISRRLSEINCCISELAHIEEEKLRLNIDRIALMKQATELEVRLKLDVV